MPQTGITGLLRAWRQGNEQALEDLLPIVYDELRRIARQHLRRERPGLTLQPTALVHEAYLRLVDANRVELRDRLHFFAIASRIMRRVLVDAARARATMKRGGALQRVALQDVAAGDFDRDVRLAAFDAALETLASESPRKARVVEMRVFGGLSVQETASMLEVSVDTVGRDWSFAKSWLKRELKTSTS
jgi:RNA polymerase sigma factor (TIGR02999 family)